MTPVWPLTRFRRRRVSFRALFWRKRDRSANLEKLLHRSTRCSGRAEAPERDSIDDAGLLRVLETSRRWSVTVAQRRHYFRGRPEMAVGYDPIFFVPSEGKTAAGDDP